MSDKEDTSVSSGYFFVVHIPLWQIFIATAFIVLFIYLVRKRRSL